MIDVPTTGCRRVRSRLMAGLDNHGSAGSGDGEGDATGGERVYTVDWSQPSGGLGLRAVLEGQEMGDSAGVR